MAEKGTTTEEPAIPLTEEEGRDIMVQMSLAKLIMDAEPSRGLELTAEVTRIMNGKSFGEIVVMASLMIQGLVMNCPKEFRSGVIKFIAGIAKIEAAKAQQADEKKH